MPDGSRSWSRPSARAAGSERGRTIRGSYLPVLQQLDAWQEAASAAHPGIIPCQAGCSACCRGPFDISVADAALVVEAVRHLPLAIRRDVATRAREQVQSMQRRAPEWRPPFDIGSIGDDLFDSISDAMADMPCPLLDSEGGCRIYGDRPMVCRMIGVGMATESGAVIPNACPIQDQFPGYSELEPVPFGLEDWETAEDREKTRAALDLFGTPDASGYETTVAGAVVLGFETR